MPVTKLLLFFVRVIHEALIWGNFIAIPLLILLQPWYIWLPIVSCIASPLLDGVNCRMVRLENKLRKKIKLEQIKHEDRDYVRSKKID